MQTWPQTGGHTEQGLSLIMSPLSSWLSPLTVSMTSSLWIWRSPLTTLALLSLPLLTRLVSHTSAISSLPSGQSCNQSNQFRPSVWIDILVPNNAEIWNNTLYSYVPCCLCKERMCNLRKVLFFSNFHPSNQTAATERNWAFSCRIGWNHHVNEFNFSNYSYWLCWGVSLFHSPDLTFSPSHSQVVSTQKGWSLQRNSPALQLTLALSTTRRSPQLISSPPSRQSDNYSFE